MDYLILKDYEIDAGWSKILFFDHALTNGDIDRVQDIIQKVKNDLPEDYAIEDIETEIAKILPYTNSITLSNYDTYHTLYF